MADTRYSHQITPDTLNTSHSLAILTVPPGSTVLDIGAADGSVARVLVERGCRVWGLEVDPDAAERASQFCERVIVGDIAQIDLDEVLDGKRFEFVLLLDVLEHLPDPLAALRKVRDLLARSGRIIASIPNVTHGAVRLQLLKGAFTYTETGLLDRSHLRFFDRQGMESLMNGAGLTILERLRVTRGFTETEVPVDLSTMPPSVVEDIERDADAKTYQFVVVARPSTDDWPRPSVPSLAERLQQRNLELEASYKQLEHYVKSELAVAQQLRTELDAHRRRVAELEPELTSRMQELHERHRETRHLVADLAVREAWLAELRQVSAQQEHMLADARHELAHQEQMLAYARHELDRNRAVLEAASVQVVSKIRTSLERHPRLYSSLRRIVRGIAKVTGAVAGLLLFGIVTACTGTTRDSTSPAATRGYVLVSIDTLRADHLGAYGYHRPTSPYFDSLAARGVLFENAIAQIPGTLPSHMSMFTGLYPAEHGVYPPNGALSPDIETIAEAFRRAGFRTAGHTEGGFVDGSYGFARGFESFDDDALHHADDVERTFARARGFIEGLKRDERFFLFVHTYAIHDPYDPPAPYGSLYWTGAPPEGFAPTGENLASFNAGNGVIQPAALEYYIAQYDGSINHVDDQLRKFFDWLEALVPRDQLTVIITSDHGEEFLDHGKMVHEQVYHENLRVPLLIVHPRVADGTRVRSLVQTIDIAPTLYNLAGIRPSAKLSGTSRASLLVDRDQAKESAAYAEAFTTRDRAIYHQDHGRLYQLIQFAPRLEPDGFWVSRSVVFDAAGDRLKFSAHSHAEPRTVSLQVNGVPHGLLEVPLGWREFEIRLPPDNGVQTVRLWAEGCTSPAASGQGNDRRCLAFKIRGVSLMRTELYDLARDPGATTNLSRDFPEVGSDLSNRLSQATWQLIASPDSVKPGSELLDRLRGLGYIR